MIRGLSLYEWLGMFVVFPFVFLATSAFLFWITDSDPLVQEIWRLRGQNSMLRERLAELEGKAVSDTGRLKRAIK